MSNKTMKLKLKIWRQKSANEKGKLVDYDLDGVSPDMSFLEMFDLLNDNLVQNGEESIAFDHDCREGICGMCSLMINGEAHGPKDLTTTCQLHMRSFNDGDTIVIEPFRAKAFPVLKDLMIDRSGFDKIIQAGGYVSVNTGMVPAANTILVNKKDSDLAMDAAACIGCGACVASCPNASGMLFLSAKVSQLALLPQGKPEAKKRVQNMLNTMDDLGFGNCTNHAECEAQCPKGVDISNIARMNREFIKASFTAHDE
jgi:succinate dehydrogenase / fumarate reductase iron-sulfur subunit